LVLIKRPFFGVSHGSYKGPLSPPGKSFPKVCEKLKRCGIKKRYPTVFREKFQRRGNTFSWKKKGVK